MKLQNRYFHLTIFIVVVALDQVSKFLVRGYFTGAKRYDIVEVIDGFFNLLFVENRGMIWGIFSGFGRDLSGYLLIISASIIAFGILAYLYFKSEHKIEAFAMVLIAGGAIGNIIDRIVIGGVTDFIDIYFGTYHWPAFNIADAFINIGVAFMFYCILFKKEKKES